MRAGRKYHILLLFLKLQIFLTTAVTKFSLLSLIEVQCMSARTQEREKPAQRETKERTGSEEEVVGMAGEIWLIGSEISAPPTFPSKPNPFVQFPAKYSLIFFAPPAARCTAHAVFMRVCSHFRLLHNNYGFASEHRKTARTRLGKNLRCKRYAMIV